MRWCLRKRYYGLLATLSLFLLAYFTGPLLSWALEIHKLTNNYNHGQRSLKTGVIEVKGEYGELGGDAVFLNQDGEIVQRSRASPPPSPPISPPPSPPTSPPTSALTSRETSTAQPDERSLIQRVLDGQDVKRLSLRPASTKLPAKIKPNLERSLFSLAQYVPGRRSKPVVFGLNRAMEALNKEFSPNPDPGRPVKLTAGGNFVPFDMSRAKTMSFVGGLKVGTKLEPTQTKNILIATTWRSGSSFLGDMLNQYPGSFYFFEPLHYYDKISDLSSVVHKEEFLKTLFSCEFDSRNIGYLHHVSKPSNRFLLQRHNPRYWQSCSYLLPRQTMCFMPEYIHEICSLHPVRLMKTVRMRVADTAVLLADPSLNLKVVVLVRDPRGVYASRNEETIANWCKDEECADPVVGCQHLLMDIQSARELESDYPGRVLLVRYEDLSTSPLQTSRNILHFLGLPWTERMQRFIATHTKGAPAPRSRQESPATSQRSTGETKVDPYSTSRNSSSTPFRWRETLDWENITSIQSSCREGMKELGYRILVQPEEMLSQARPIDLSPGDIWPSWRWEQ